MNQNSYTLILRGKVINFTGDPFTDAKAFQYFDDGVVLIHHDKIVALGAFDNFKDLPHHKIIHYPDSIISAGFIDAHVHMPQMEMIASYGEKLLDWLSRYTFPTEQKYADETYARTQAKHFLKQLLRNGVTTAAVYTTTFAQSCQTFFEEAQKLNLRMLAGKVMMDRNAPAALLDTPEKSYDESLLLIDRWHQKNRLSYIITPRFAPTSSEAQLEVAQVLLKKDPTLYLQSHVSENKDEVQWVKELFPKAKSYTDVYARYDLLARRSIYGHGIYLGEEEFQLFHDSGAAIAHCPSSNFFLGSGIFNLSKALDAGRPVHVALGSDVGAGDSLSPFHTMNHAYKASALASNKLSSIKAFYLATRGAATALDLDDKVGSLNPGIEADITVINTKSTDIISQRMNHCESIEDMLFVLMMLADDRAVQAVYSGGQLVYQNSQYD